MVVGVSGNVEPVVVGVGLKWTWCWRWRVGHSRVWGIRGSCRLVVGGREVECSQWCGGDAVGIVVVGVARLGIGRER